MDSNLEDKESEKKINVKISLLILLMCFCFGIIIFLIFRPQEKILKQNLYSVSVSDYNLSSDFNLAIHEYDLIVNSNIIEINCDADSKIDGCNVSLDLTGKEEYIHKIEFYDGKQTNTYKIKIKNVTKNEIDDFYIKDIKGNTSEWTNKDLTMEVIMAPEGIYSYSIDSGNTWQSSNKFIIKENGKYELVVKDKSELLKKTKNIEIDKIDKEKPQVTINKTNIEETKITLEVSAYDALSGIEAISFNGGEFTTKTKYEVTKAGKYYFVAKDKAGNISEKKNVEIKNTDFKPQVQPKTYTVTVHANGTKLEKNIVSCTTTEESCEIILPKIITNYTVIGWGESSSAKVALYSQGEKIKVNKDLNLYAITKRTFTAEFFENGALKISNKSQSCTAYNTDKCEIITPNIITVAEVIGWGESSNSKEAKISVNQKVELTKNIKYYAITKKTYTAQFNKGTAQSIGSSSLTCTAYNTEECYVITPKITTISGKALGWSRGINFNSVYVGEQEKLILKSNETYRAVVEYVYNATFYSEGLDYLEASTLSCTARNSDSCTITLPRYNKKGHFSSYWSIDKDGMKDLTGIKKNSDYFKKTGSSYKLKKDITFYPNFNSAYYSDTSSNTNKFRNINISQTVTIGKTIFEFESGIPQNAINEFVKVMKDVYNQEFPWLFLQGKVFIMNKSTYDYYSRAYALTHGLNNSSFTIDLQYDTELKWIGINGALHELAHAWDRYYLYKTGKRLCDSNDFNVVYSAVYNRLHIEEDGSRLSKKEAIVSMFTNYYWHILGYDKVINTSESKPWYGLEDRNQPLDDYQKEVVKNFMEKYSSISANGYNKIN